MCLGESSIFEDFPRIGSLPCRRKPGLLLPPAPNLLSRALSQGLAAASNSVTGLTASAWRSATGFPGLSEQRDVAAASTQAR